VKTFSRATALHVPLARACGTDILNFHCAHFTNGFFPVYMRIYHSIWPMHTHG